MCCDAGVSALWPLADLEVLTPRLALRYLDDGLGEELAVLAAKGIHDPATMPFAEAWTDAPAADLEHNTLRYFWRNRAETSAEHWNLNFAAQLGGTAIGMCSVEASGFTLRRAAETGSWLGRRYQGQGLGAEMRQAALHLIFAGFDADQATTSAWHDNHASLRVTRSLPYVQTGTHQQLRRGQPDTMVDFVMSRALWAQARRDDIQLTGIEAVRGQLKTTRRAATPR
jgi:RimJ/RimL family protein N-acetyltransferase